MSGSERGGDGTPARGSGTAGRIGVMLLHFGEPGAATPEAVVPFLERIFFANASLEGVVDADAARVRSRELAERRAPGLIAEYEAIGGSPMNRQAFEQAERLGEELRGRGRTARIYTGMQFTDPLIEDAAARAMADGVDTLIALPVYPLCGPSTTVAALAQLAGAVDALGWDVALLELSGWHRHPAYARLRAEGVRRTAADAGVALADCRLVFSAHGTPVRYLREGSRYDRYVAENCGQIAAELGVAEYTLGFQNHTNRPVEWTQPDIDAAVRALAGVTQRVIVVPISFMHEQSETLAELDGELREDAEDVGLAFQRVPVPHADPAFIALLADLVEARLDGDDAFGFRLARCRCRPSERTVCLNA